MGVAPLTFMGTAPLTSLGAVLLNLIGMGPLTLTFIAHWILWAWAPLTLMRMASLAVTSMI